MSCSASIRNSSTTTSVVAAWLNRAFLLLDRIGRMIDPLVPRALRARAIRRAEQWINARANGEDGLGAIFPAMVNALEVMVMLGYGADDPRRVQAKRALCKLVVEGEHAAYCQPCVSPVWDTALGCLALEEEGSGAGRSAAFEGLQWLRPLQLLEAAGDWRTQRPELPGGGWAFQFSNSYYPDLDDTAAVAWAMHAAPQRANYAAAIGRALDWLVGMQSRNGGFASFDVDNTYYYLNEIPFADHGALLDPPTADVTARVVTVLARVGREQDAPALLRAIAYLRASQQADGSWFGRWGTNYIYGTWSVLVALAGRRHRHGGCGGTARGGMAGQLPAGRRRLGREQRQLPGSGPGRPRHRQHALSDCLGAAGADVGGRCDASSATPRRSVPAARPAGQRPVGAPELSPRRAFRACSI